MRRSGVRIPLAPPQADIRSGCRFFVCLGALVWCLSLCCSWRRWCSGRRVGAGLLDVPVGGGPPASRPRRELRSARRLEARPGPAAAHWHRSQALRSLRRLPHQWGWVAEVRSCASPRSRARPRRCPPAPWLVLHIPRVPHQPPPGHMQVLSPCSVL